MNIQQINVPKLEAVVTKAEAESIRLAKVINYAQRLRMKHERQRAQALQIIEFMKGQP